MSEFVSDLQERVVMAASAFGVSRDVAGMIAAEVVTSLRIEWAGSRIYLDKGGGKSERNRAIIRDFKNGESVQLLVRRYKLSRVRIWQIVSGQ